MAGGRIGLGHDNVPMAVCNPFDGTGLLMFDNKHQGRVEPELVAQRLCRPLELLPVHRQLRRDDEMAQGVNTVEPLRVVNGVVQVRDRATQDRDALVVVAIGQVPRQSRRSRRCPDPTRLDEHDAYRPSRA